MKEGMKIRIAISAMFLLVSSFAQGQAVPTAESSMASSLGPNLPNLDGVVHYALSASEVVQYGYYGPGQTSYATDLTGDIAYNSKSTARPFSALFAGGVILGNQAGQGTTSFWNLAVSQGYVTRHWVFGISDSFSYLPQSPTTGLSGIPGVGDLGGVPVQSPVEGPAGGVLTTSGSRISNGLSGSAERQITATTSVSGTGSWGVLHYLDSSNAGEGLDSTQVSGVVAINHRIDALSSASVSAVYSTYYYTGAGAGPDEPSFQTRGINVSYQRVLSRTLSVNATVGPQWVSSSNSALIPNSTDIAVSAGLQYLYRNATHFSVNYSRGVTPGSGVLAGAFSDGVVGSASRAYGRDWVASLNAAYTHTSSLAQFTPDTAIFSATGNYSTVYGGVQVTRRFSTHFSGYASYTAQNQSANNLNGLAAQGVLSGTSHTFGVGVTFTPRSTSLGQF
jgi:hypothetical protein